MRDKKNSKNRNDFFSFSRKLTWLNLSYNKIEYLQGFQDLWGHEYSLAIIQMHGNHIE